MSYEYIFGGKMRIKKGYLWICILLGILFFIFLTAGCNELIEGLELESLSFGDVKEWVLEKGIKFKYTIKW